MYHRSMPYFDLSTIHQVLPLICCIAVFRASLLKMVKKIHTTAIKQSAGNFDQKKSKACMLQEIEKPIVGVLLEPLQVEEIPITVNKFRV